MASPYSSSTITSAFQLAATNHKPNNMPLIKNINLLDCIEILHTNRKGIMAQGKGEKKMWLISRWGGKVSQQCESFKGKENISEYISEGAECLQRHT